MSGELPHSAIHATQVVDLDEKDEKGGESAVKSVAIGIGAQFQRMRRRLTVTGNVDTIDGVSKLTVSEEESLKQHAHHSPVKCAVTDYAGVTKKGHAPYNPRKKNQDALIMEADKATGTLVLCVLDGHGEHGDGVSGVFRDGLTKEMFSHAQWKTDIQKATADAIHKVEQQVIKNYRIDTEFSGTTLSMAIIRGNQLTGVNIGDSRVILGKKESDLEFEEITFDHKPDTPAEKKRILQCGGRVFAVEYDDGIDGPMRVWLGHMDVPGLAMSRSLGDAVAHTAGVISTPEFTTRELNPESDKFLIVATDGLWEFVDNKETVDMADSHQTPSEAVDSLVKEASLRWMREEQVIDDTTVIVANLFGYKSKE
jgi:serine/threonine protein phosphatase PrpC